MRRFLVVTLAFTCFFGRVVPCWSYPLPSAKSLPDAVGGADLVAIFKVDSLDLKAKPVPKPSGPSGLFLGPEAAIAMSTFEGEGTYKLTTVKNIKGDVGAELTLNLPTLTYLGYASAFHMKIGDFLIAFLRKEKNSWVAQDPMRPFVPLFNNPDLTIIQGESPLQQVESLIVPELKDENVQLMAADLLSYSVNPRVLVALAPYVEDPNLRLRDFVLTTFARNRQFGVINRIRDLNRLTAPKRASPRVVVELANFSGIQQAVPLLNPLLFEDEQYIRINALGALSRTKDASSIPFLLLTLYDSERQMMNAPKAYAIFSQVSGAKLTVGAGNFAAHPEQAQKEAWTWWRDELAGKHPRAADDKDRIILLQGQTFGIADLPQLNEALFMRYESTRRTAIAALGKLADQSSVPYLLIALRDPQLDVAWGAHRILARLVPALGPAQERAIFNTNREQVAEAGAKWWSQHLRDAETARLPEFLRDKAAPKK